MSEQNTAPYEAPDFAEFITDLAHGDINQKLTEALAQITTAVEDTGKVGELTLKLHVKKEAKMAAVSVDFKVKVPSHPLRGTLFYIGANGELLREDPRQMSLKGLDKPKLKTVKD